MTSPAMGTPRHRGSPYGWVDLLIPVLCLALGVSGIIRGYHAQQHGQVLAPTAKSGPMTGAAGDGRRCAIVRLWSDVDLPDGTESASVGGARGEGLAEGVTRLRRSVSAI